MARLPPQNPLVLAIRRVTIFGQAVQIGVSLLPFPREIGIHGCSFHTHYDLTAANKRRRQTAIVCATKQRVTMQKDGASQGPAYPFP